MVDLMCSELELRRDFLNDQHIRTIYFGGGTPSLLSEPHLQSLMQKINAIYSVDENAEITLEANPDDVTREKLTTWKALGINRLSVGVQTFDEERLARIHRAHNRQQALQSIQLAMELGFMDLNCDLIYAIPPGALSTWIADVEQMIDFGIPHLSLYGLTIEEGTVFGHQRAKGEFEEVSEQENAEQYQYAIERLGAAGYKHYEVSNFCLPGRESRHNSGYWQQKEYLGIGPGAHSYNGQIRAHAIRNNAQYIAQMTNGRPTMEIEELSIIDQVNEYVMTRVRTLYGIDTAYLDSKTQGAFSTQNKELLQWLVREGKMTTGRDEVFTITSDGMYTADEIALKLFLT